MSDGATGLLPQRTLTGQIHGNRGAASPVCALIVFPNTGLGFADSWISSFFDPMGIFLLPLLVTRFVS